MQIQTTASTMGNDQNMNFSSLLRGSGQFVPGPSQRLEESTQSGPAIPCLPPLFPPRQYPPDILEQIMDAIRLIESCLPPVQKDIGPRGPQPPPLKPSLALLLFAPPAPQFIPLQVNV